MSAIKLLAIRADLIRTSGCFDLNSVETVPSPCISVCRMTEDRSHCEGCFRSIEEIRAWSGADTAQRLAIWARLAQRAGLAFPPTGLPVGLQIATPE